MTSSCRLPDILLMAYADGETTPGEAGHVEAHLAQCAACRQRVAEWRDLGRTTDLLLVAHTTASQQSRAGTPTWSAQAGRPGASPLPASRPTAGPDRSRPPEQVGLRQPRRPQATLVMGLVMSLLALILVPVAVRHQTLGDAASALRPVEKARPQASRQSSAPTTVTTVAGAPIAKDAEATDTGKGAPAAARAGTLLQGRIAYVRNGQLWVHTAEGEGRIATAGQVAAPRWSPSGHWLLYESGRPGQPAQLWLIDPAASAPPLALRAPIDRGQARWSPVRDELAVAPSDGSLWLLSAGTSSPRRLLPGGGRIGNLAWSPDGAELAVEGQDTSTSAQAISLVTRSGARTVVPLAAPSEPGGTGSSHPALPVLGTWSPASNAFTFWWGSRPTSAPSSPAPLALWSAPSGARPALPAVLMYRDFVSWAPDGHAFAAIASVALLAGTEPVGHVVVVPVAGPAAPRLLDEPGRAAGDVAWSPDGRLLAYSSSAVPVPDDTPHPPRQIWVEQPDGSQRRPLTSGPDDSFPQWSRDGQEMLYVHGTGAGAELWVVGRNGSGAHRILDGLPGLQDLAGQFFGSSGLVSYRGIFDWTAAVSRP